MVLTHRLQPKRAGGRCGDLFGRGGGSRNTDGALELVGEGDEGESGCFVSPVIPGCVCLPGPETERPIGRPDERQWPRQQSITSGLQLQLGLSTWVAAVGRGLTPATRSKALRSLYLERSSCHLAPARPLRHRRGIIISWHHRHHLASSSPRRREPSVSSTIIMASSSFGIIWHHLASSPPRRRTLPSGAPALRAVRRRRP